MKKIAAVLLASFILTFIFAQAAFAGIATTAPQESTSATTHEGYEEGMVRGLDISTPITICVIAAASFIVYGIFLLRKHKNDTL